MNNESVFKKLNLFIGVVFIILIGKTVMEIYYMPEELYLYSLELPINTGLLIFGLIVALVHLVSIFLLYFFVKIGKMLFVGSFILMIAVGLLSGVMIVDHIDYFLDSLHGVASGAIILMLYSSPIKERF